VILVLLMVCFYIVNGMRVFFCLDRCFLLCLFFSRHGDFS
jgi:hypothetical protein